MDGVPIRNSPLVRTLVVVLLITNGVLGFMVVTLTSDVSDLRTQAATNERVQAVEERVAAAEEAVLVALQTPSNRGRSTRDVDSDLQALEKALFGFTGTPALQDDAIGNIEERLDDLESCINRLVSQLATQLSLPTRFPSFSRC